MHILTLILFGFGVPNVILNSLTLAPMEGWYLNMRYLASSEGIILSRIDVIFHHGQVSMTFSDSSVEFHYNVVPTRDEYDQLLTLSGSELLYKIQDLYLDPNQKEILRQRDTAIIIKAFKKLTKTKTTDIHYDNLRGVNIKLIDDSDSVIIDDNTDKLNFRLTVNTDNESFDNAAAFLNIVPVVNIKITNKGQITIVSSGSNVIINYLDTNISNILFVSDKYSIDDNVLIRQVAKIMSYYVVINH